MVLYLLSCTILNCLDTVSFSFLTFLIVKQAVICQDFYAKFGSKIARNSAILLSRHCHRSIIYCFSATATCATFFSSRQWRGGTKIGTSAQHCLQISDMALFKVLQD